MSAPSEFKHGHWSSRLAFILAAVGSSVGLGNFWRFPFEAGENGGGAFVVIYFVCVLLIGLPLLMSELAIGRRAGLSAVGSFRKIADESGRSPAWRVVGWVGTIACFVTLSFYSVIAGWILAYLPIIASGKLVNADAASVGQMFGDLLANPVKLTIYHAIFMGLTTLIVARGIKGGLEPAVKILMPAFFAMLLLVTITSGYLGDFGAAASFLFTPDFSKVTPDVVLSAFGQAFFSIGLTGALMVTYGAYMTRESHIPRAGFIVVLCDTLVAVIAGLAIFPIVFGFGLDASAGPGLLFVTLPVGFAQMGAFGTVFGLVFFVLALFAALTSSISLLEVTTSWSEEHSQTKRAPLAIMLGFAAFLLGVGSVLSLNVWSDVHPLGFIPLFEGQGILDMLDNLVAKILLPTAGILVAIFAGWFAARQVFIDEFNFKNEALFNFWHFLVRFVCPLGLVLVLVFGLIG